MSIVTRFLLLCATVLALLAACATERVMTTGTQYPPTNSSSVKIYQSQKPSSRYEEIGRVTVDKYDNFGFTRSADELNATLKEKAASIGGNAVIGVTEDFASLSGVVVRYK